MTQRVTQQTVRVYLPVTLELLALLRDTGALPASSEGVVPDGDDEPAEYAALMTAADACVGLLTGAGRRVVVVAQTADPDAAITLADVVAVHADPVDRPADADLDDDLAWYAVQEIDDLIEGKH